MMPAMDKIINTIPVVCMFWNGKRELVFSNRAAADFFELESGEEFIARFDELTPELQPCGTSSSEKMRKYLDLTFSFGYCQFDWLHQLPDGTPIPTEVFLLRTPHDGEQGVVGYIEDLRLGVAERLVYESYHHRLELIFDTMPLLITLWDKDGEIVDCNIYAQNILEAPSKQDVIINYARYCKKIQPCGTPAAELAAHCVTEALEKGTSTARWTYLTVSGEEIPCDVTCQRIEWGNKPIVTCFAQDRRILEQLEAAMLKTQEAARAKSDFLADMSHEVRTPLSAIVGMVAMGKAAEDIAGKNYALDNIEIASRHLLKVVNDILEIKKIEANKFELIVESFSFADMVAEVASIITFLINEKRQKFVCDIDTGIPARIDGDVLRIKQVLLNLLNNAVKFTAEEGTITLRAYLHEKAGLLYVTVRDTGVGIPPEHLPLLFTAYEQAEQTRKLGGTGLGLVISKRFVESMGGSIRVESTLGQGTAIHFTLPLKESREVQDNSANALGEHIAHFAGRRILLAEDIDINREIIMAMLRPTGVEIICTEDGEAAVEAFRAAPSDFDLILTDIKMPKLDGFDTAKQIRETPHVRAKTIPIIAMTANVLQEDIDRCMQAGMNDHLTKPLDYERVLNVIERYLTAS